MTVTPLHPAPIAAEIPALPPATVLTTLDNGLTIIVREDHSAPVVSAQAWCMAGSIHEGRWLGAGMSHVLEHMLFKGTANRPGSRIDQEVQEAGGYMNAYTSFDRTVYHIDVPNTGAAVAVDILCDIMQNATIPPDELEKEKQVIVREMDMNVDDPGRRASRRLFETAYTRSPYRHTVIGYRGVFDQLKHEDILGYYREKYAPNNVFFVVAGDVRSAEVVAQISAAYTTSQRRPLEAAYIAPEPPQAAPREVIEEAPIELGHLHFAWHIPELRHPDIPLLDLLAAILGNGRSSRLYRHVREGAGLVHSADAWTYNPGNPGLFGISATFDADRFAAARAALLEQIEILKATEVSAGELSKAVKQFVSGTLACRKTMQGQAQDLGSNWLAASDLNFSERYLAAAKRVLPADIRRVCNQYLTSENRTLYALLPEGSVASTTATVTETTDHAIERVQLPNGLRLLIKEDHRLPFLEFRCAFRGGLLAETVSDNGITQLMGKLLLKGTARRSAEEISNEIESLGGSIDSYGGNNSFGVNCEVLSSDFQAGVDLLADVLRNPAFPAPALERERQIQLAGLRSQRDHLLSSAFKSMRRALFGPGGYGLDVLGSEESLARLTPDALRRYHGRHARPDNAVLAIFGDVFPEEVKQAVSAALGSWQNPPGAVVVPEPAEVAPNPYAPTSALPARVTETRDKKQAVLSLGFPGTTLLHPDRYALELIQESCSDLGSRLFLRIREELGLAYYVGAQNFLGLAPGFFAFYAGTEPASVARVEEELLKETELLRKEGLTAAELARAKAKVIGQRKIARQDLGALAANSSLDELYGLGFNYFDTEDARYEAVSLADILAVANKYLNPTHAVLAVVQPPAES